MNVPCPDVANTYHNRGMLYHYLADHHQAKEHYQRALSIRLKKLGPDHVNVAGTYHTKDYLHHYLGDHQRAKEYYERAPVHTTE